jgi:endonuclease YncB( thermonuclease family)
MAKVQFKKEWRIWAGVAAVLGMLVVYLYLVSRPPMEGGKYLYYVTDVTGPDQLSLRGAGKAINFQLIGLNIPDSQREAAREFLTSTLRGQWIGIRAIREGKKGEQIGFVYLSGDDINARMIRMGLAEIDTKETGFDVRPYIELQQEAKRQQRGLWAESGRGAE